MVLGWLDGIGFRHCGSLVNGSWVRVNKTPRDIRVTNMTVSYKASLELIMY